MKKEVHAMPLCRRPINKQIKPLDKDNRKRSIIKPAAFVVQLIKLCKPVFDKIKLSNRTNRKRYP